METSDRKLSIVVYLSFFLSFIFSFTLIAPLAAAQEQEAATECELLELEIANTTLTVSKGEVATYRFDVTNNGAEPQTLAISAICDPARTALICEIAAPYPNVLTPGETGTYFFNVATKDAAVGLYSLPLIIEGGTIPGSCAIATMVNLTIKPAPTLAIAASAQAQAINALVKPGEVAEWALAVRNNLDETIYTRLDASESPFKQGLEFEVSEFKLAAREQRVVRVGARVPLGTPGGAYEWLFLVRITSLRGVELLTLPARIQVVAPSAALQLFGGPPTECIITRQGEVREWVLTMRNIGEERAAIALALEPSHRAITISPSFFELAPLGWRTIKLRVAPTLTDALGIFHYYLVARVGDFTLLRRAYCIDFRGVEDVAIEAPQRIEITRAHSARATFTIRNIGTRTDNFTISWLPIDDIETTVKPTAFTLQPGQSTVAEIFLNTSMETRLRDDELIFAIEAELSAYTRQFSIPLSILSSGAANESLLAIEAPAFEVIEGDVKSFNVVVRNLGDETLKDVNLSIEGIPRTWWTTAPAAHDITGGESASFELTFNATPAPNASVAGDYEIKLIAASGREHVLVPTTLKVKHVIINLLAKVLNFQAIEKERVVREVRLNLSIANLGNIRLRGVGASLLAPIGEYLFASESTDLSPGETRVIEAVIRPNEKTPSRTVAIQALHFFGASTPEQIKLPPMVREGYAPKLPWLTIAGVIVLSALLVTLAYLWWRARREEYPELYQKPIVG